MPADLRVKFERDCGFQVELRRRVDEYFARTQRRQRDCPRMYLKTAIVLSWCIASYVLLVCFATSWAWALPLAISLGLSMAAIGFNVQHDGGHNAYSDRPVINRLTALSLDLLGASSYVWQSKHNLLHHSYANITGHDDDIDIGLLGRLSPHQPRLSFHRFQHFYLWLLYGLLPIKWQLYDDFRDCLRGRVGTMEMAKPRGWDLLILLGGKALFMVLAFGLPLLVHPWWAVLSIYVLASFVQGVTMSVIFQLAHCVEPAGFPLPHEESGRMEKPWAVHQVETTVDFGRHNRLLSWFAGGLNFQVEHHLFPRICHVHYPALAQVVEETCHDFDIAYLSHGTLRGALAAHYRWLRRMGLPEAAVPVAELQA